MRSSSAARICSASARSEVIAGTTSSAASQLRNSSACSATIARACAASPSRSAMLRRTASSRSSMLTSVTPSTSATAGSMSRGSARSTSTRRPGRHVAGGRSGRDPNRRADDHVGLRHRLRAAGRAGRWSPSNRSASAAPRSAAAVGDHDRDAAPRGQVLRPPARPPCRPRRSARGRRRGRPAARAPARRRRMQPTRSSAPIAVSCGRACRPRAPRGTAGWRPCRSIPSRSACW